MTDSTLHHAGPGVAAQHNLPEGLCDNGCDDGSLYSGRGRAFGSSWHAASAQIMENVIALRELHHKLLLWESHRTERVRN